MTTPPESRSATEGTGGELAGPVIAALITHELEIARGRASSLQARGLAVISSAGTLVTLLFGLSALATKAENFALPSSTKLPLAMAAVCLIAAAVAAIWTNAPRKVGGIALTDLESMITGELWRRPAAGAQQKVAVAQLRMAQGERAVNKDIARKLAIAICLEIAGIACVAWAVIALIVNG